MCLYWERMVKKTHYKEQPPKLLIFYGKHAFALAKCQALFFFPFFFKKNKIEWYCILHYTILVISLEIHFGKLLKGELSSFSPHVSPPIYFPFSLVLCGDSTTEIMHFQPLKVVSSYQTKKIISLTSLIYKKKTRLICVLLFLTFLVLALICVCVCEHRLQ